jgi:methionyl-tRNA synthetase
VSHSENKPLYLTTPLYYVNGRPHLGHAYATILADVLTRFSRQNGRKTRFLTGTDEHGEKIAASAKKENKSAADYASDMSLTFRRAWEHIGLEPDVFYRTTDAEHYKLVQSALDRLKASGDIYFGSYEGKYCVGCERFRTDKEWSEKGLCPDHLTPPDVRKESNYFFKMSAYRDKLIEHYKAHPEAIYPPQYMKEVLSFLEQPLEDFSISRPLERLSWGIPLPFDKGYVTYVWFDALLSYLGGLGFDGGELKNQKSFQSEFWVESTHLIGKDILKTHGIYWPTMLMALGVPVFRRLQVSGFWLTSGMKMSKSLGNVVDPVNVNDRFGIEPFRFFLLREMSYGGDANFTWESFVARANAELANGLGNLASRTLTLTHKNLNAQVPSREGGGAAEEALLKRMHELPAAFKAEFDASRYHMGLAKFSECVADCDRYINEQKPWALAKEGKLDQLKVVLGTAMNALWTLSVVGHSVMPVSCSKLRIALGSAQDSPKAPPDFSQATKLLEPGTPLGEVPRLFPRLELPKEENQ